MRAPLFASAVAPVVSDPARKQDIGIAQASHLKGSLHLFTCRYRFQEYIENRACPYSPVSIGGCLEPYVGAQP